MRPFKLRPRHQFNWRSVTPPYVPLHQLDSTTPPLCTKLFFLLIADYRFVPSTCGGLNLYYRNRYDNRYDGILLG